MAQKKAVDNVMTWIADEKRVHECSDHSAGANQKAVEDGLVEQKKRVQLVNDYKTEVDRVVGATKDPEVQDRVTGAYDELTATANKRLDCLTDIAQVASLEDLFNSLSVQFATRATSLVQNACESSNKDDEKEDEGTGGDGIARAAQSCILSVRNNWAWISKLVKCADVHLEHVSDYHQFFHEIKEYGDWMPVELRKVQDKVSRKEDGQGSTPEARKLLLELKEVLYTFLHWQGKVNNIFDRCKKIIPIQLRTQKNEIYRPITSLCNYKTNEISIQEGEELTLIDNSQPQLWLVRNMHTTESSVPSVICLIPGPDPEAVRAAMELRLRLLGIWTQNVKRIGKSMIWFLTLVFKNPEKDMEEVLKSLSQGDRDAMVSTLDFINKSLSKYWESYPDFQTLQGQFTKVKEILADGGSGKDKNGARSLSEKVAVVDDMLRRYQDFWSNWETYKVLVETSKHGEHLLISDKWQDLNFIEMAELMRKWHNGLEFSESELQLGDSALGESNGYSKESSTVTNIESTTHTAKTGQISHSEQEEKKTFVITGVIDPRSGEEVSMHQAVMLGIINSKEGTYVNPDTGIAMPIPEAMNKGQIKVEFTTTKKSVEKRRDVGLITIRTQKESRPYTVKAVVDAKTETELSVDEAIDKKILNQTSGTYYNNRENLEMSLGDALDSGLLIVEFDKDAPEVAPEVITRTYAIHAVVDQACKQRVSFTDAVKKGLINRETGAYHHSTNDEFIYVGEAIKRGFIKATVVKDPNSMDIDPENKMVVDKVQAIRKKMLTPLKAMAALKKAAENGK